MQKTPINTSSSASSWLFIHLHVWLVFNSAIRSPCYLQSLTHLPTDVPAKHLLQHATYIGHQRSTNTSIRVCRLSEITSNSWWEWAMACRGENIFRKMGQEKSSSILLSGCASLSTWQTLYYIYYRNTASMKQKCYMQKKNTAKKFQSHQIMNEQ
jgi:hypothetical protein